MASSPGLDYKDYYAVLGLPKTASQADVKKAFRKLARQHHPDAKPGDTAAERKFKEINEANEVLSDPAKRKQYDELGANWEAISRARSAGAGTAGGAGPYGGFGGPAGGSGNVRYEFHTADAGEFSDFFRMFFGSEAPGPSPTSGGRGSRPTGGIGFEDILAGMGIDGRPAAQSGQPGGASARPAAPVVHEATADLTLEEAYHGTTRLVEVDGKRLEITIPPGADTGSRIKLTGRGPGGGDLIVVTRLIPDTTFTRRGADLERELPLTLEEALLGAQVKVGTLKGRVLLTIPPGTQPGRTFRLRGQGMPRFKAAGHGDLFVKARVVLPTDLSDEARAAAKVFADLARQPDPR
ncbi:MAG TPA: J domain-containing protein [Candidatus Limnocylindrales bacterium]|jgi:DnaJ-class molecular chaperone|nr:J domain-containing protein [Candidatus Limnocylindrales bacterium]